MRSITAAQLAKKLHNEEELDTKEGLFLFKDVAESLLGQDASRERL